MTPSEIKAATRHARSNLLNGLCAQRKTFTIGWCAAFIQLSIIHVVQRAQLAEGRS